VPLNYAPILFTKDELINITGGKWIQNEPQNLMVKGFFISPDQYVPDYILVAAGGFSVQKNKPYVLNTLKKGVVAAIVDEELGDYPSWSSILLVDDTKNALEKLGDNARNKSKAAIVAITGSVGKTSIKATLANVLSAQGATFCSYGSINGGIGLRGQLALLPKDIDFGIYEIGMLGPNSIKPRSQYIKPDVALINSIAPAHIKYHADIDSIIKTKVDIVYGVKEGGSVIVPRDDVHFEKIKYFCDKSNRNINIITFGEHEESDCRLINFTKSELGGKVKATILGEYVEYIINLEGRFWVLNSIAILACVKLAGASVGVASKMFEFLLPEMRRGERFRVELEKGAVLELIDDTFNANPSSMKAAINMLDGRLKPKNGRKILVIGDMEELGTDEKKYHTDLKYIIEKSGIDCICTVGDKMKTLFNVIKNKEIYHAKDSSIMAEELNKYVRSGDLILVKGSNKTKMDRIITKFISQNRKEYMAPVGWSVRRELDD